MNLGREVLRDAATDSEIRVAVGPRRVSAAEDRLQLQRIEWLMLVRVLVLLALTGVVGWLWLQDGGGYDRLRAVSLGLGGAFVLSLLYGLVVRRMPDLAFFTYLQLSVDALSIGLIVMVTGGVESPFRLLFVFNILAAGVLLFLRGGLIVATFDTVVFVAVGLIEWGGLLPPTEVDPIPWMDDPLIDVRLYSTVALHVVAFYLLAFLAGSLARTQRETGQALAATEDSLSRLKDMHGRIVQNINAGLLTIERAGRITSFNLGAEQITRHRAGDVLGRTLDEVLSGIAPAVGSFTEPLDSAGSGAVRERWATRRDGKRVYLRVASSVLRTAEGIVEGLIFVFEDRTRLLLMEEQLQRDERLAAVGRLAAGIAHEIRNPLASIRGSAQVLRRGLELAPDDEELMGIIEREADRLGHLVSDFLAMTREERPNRVHSRLGPAIRETLQLVESRGLSGQIEARCDLVYDPEFLLDNERIRQLLWNLVNNALAAMGKGGTLTLRTDQVTAEDLGELEGLSSAGPQSPAARPSWDGAVRVTVADTGAGIPEDALARIFDPFYTTRSGGTGLGLAIVRRIVQAHQGVITVESRVGEGTRFSLWLPVTTENPLQPSIAPNRQEMAP